MALAFAEPDKLQEQYTKEMSQLDAVENVLGAETEPFYTPPEGA